MHHFYGKPRPPAAQTIFLFMRNVGEIEIVNFDPSTGMATSFKKRGAAAAARPQHPRGSRPSLHNAQLLVSSGVPSMDALLGTSKRPNTTLS